MSEINNFDCTALQVSARIYPFLFDGLKIFRRNITRFSWLRCSSKFYFEITPTNSAVIAWSFQLSRTALEHFRHFILNWSIILHTVICYWWICWQAVNQRMKSTVKSRWPFFKIVGFASKRSLLSSPHPLPPPTFLLSPQFSRGQNAEKALRSRKKLFVRTGMLATQAIHLLAFRIDKLNKLSKG